MPPKQKAVKTKKSGHKSLPGGDEALQDLATSAKEKVPCPRCSELTINLQTHTDHYHSKVCTVKFPGFKDLVNPTGPVASIKVYRVEEKFLCPGCKKLAFRRGCKIQDHAKTCEGVELGDQYVAIAGLQGLISIGRCHTFWRAQH